MSTIPCFKFRVADRCTMGEAQWYISWDEFRELPPSLKNLTLEAEINQRKMGTEFINKLGHSLGL